MLHFKLVQHFVNRGYLTKDTVMMDVGTQNLLYVELDAAVEMVNSLRAKKMSKKDRERLEEVVYFSTPRAGERTAFLHELLELTDVTYESIDIVDGWKTTIFDLNFDAVPAEWQGHFDFVLNCGTLEHVINQSNALDFIHKCLKVDGMWFDQPPSVGFLNHGYYNYNPLFYLDFAAANGYDVEEAWYSHAGLYPQTDARFPVIDVNLLDQKEESARAASRPFPKNVKGGVAGEEAENAPAVHEPELVPSFNLNCALRKTRHDRMRYPLEIRTTHGPLSSDKVKESYGDYVFDSTSQK